MLLIDVPTLRPCGIAFVLTVNGEPQVSLTTAVIHSADGPVLAVMIHNISDLQMLDHFVLWSPVFQQLSEKIMAMDLCRMTFGKPQ